MKGAIVLCFLALAAVALARPGDSTYTDEYDNINLDEILGNKRLLENYIQCLVNEKGKCTAEGKELKVHVKEALETKCGKCTPAQRKGSEKVIGFLINHESQAWDKLKAKYDPSGKYSKKYEEELRTIKA